MIYVILSDVETLANFVADENAFFSMTLFVSNWVALLLIKNVINALSVLLLPMAFPSEINASLFNPIPLISSCFNESLMVLISPNSLPSPVKSPTTESLPSVIVPVLSENRMFI